MFPILDAAQLRQLNLGDIVTFPDGRDFSLRMIADIPDNPLRISRLLALGDLELVLAAGDAASEVQVLLPVETLPPGASSAKVLCDGAAAFWAPHLPAIGGAMGEITFRLLMLRSAFAPLAVLNRSGDHIFYLRMGTLELSRIKVTHLPVSALSSAPVARFAAVVDPIPVTVPTTAPARRLPQRSA